MPSAPPNEFVMEPPTTDYGPVNDNSNNPNATGTNSLSGTGSRRSRGLRRNRAPRNGNSNTTTNTTAVDTSPGGGGGGQASRSPATKGGSMRGALLRRTLSGEENMNVNKPPLTGGFMSGLRGKKAPSSKDVVLEASVSTAPTAAAAATSSQLPPSRSSSFDSTDGKIRSRVRATTPGAVAQALNHNGSETPPLSRTNTADSASSQNDGKPRGRARATTPGAVRSQNDNTTMNSNNNVSEPSWGASVHGSTPIKRSINARSASPVFHRKLPANNNNNNKEEEAQAIRQKQIQEIMKDTSLTQTEKQKQIQELMASGMPTSKADISRSDDERIEGNASTRSLGTEPPAANTNTTTATTTTAEEDPQTIRRKQIQEIMRDTTLSQREKQVRMQELMAGGMPKRAAMTSSAQNGAPSYHQRSRPGDDLGSSLHSRSSETDVEDAHTNAAGSGIGGAPQGKMRRITAAARPGAVSVPATREEAEGSDNTTRNLSATSREDNNNSNVNCRVSRRERIRDVNPAPAKTTTATDASPSIGVGGAPQGKMRRTGTVDTTQKPGAVSVAPPSEPTTVQTAETAATTTTTTTTTTTGVGGAPQGKVRRAVTTPASSPGAVRVAPSEPGETTTTTSSSSTAAAGDNFRRTATEPASSAGASTGVGGAPQGKFCRNTSNVSAQPGAVSVVEPTVPSEPRTRSGTSSSNAATPAGLGGAPQGKVRRTTATATTQPGAVSVTEPSNAASLDSHSSHSTEIGGVPQGKIRRTNIAASPQPGAVSSESSASKAQPGDEMALSSHHGMRRAATADLTTTTGSSTGVGGAPQGKMRRATASTPGAVSVVEQNNESGQGTGVGGAPQGKMRRGNAQSTVRRDAPSAQEPSIGSALNAPPQEPSSLVPAVSARSTESSQDNALPNAASSVERDAIAKSSVRRTRPATVTPGAQAVTAPSVAEPEQVDNDTTNAIVSSVERDMLAKSGARRSRMSATAPIRPGAQSVATPDPDDPSANEASQAERDIMSKTRARSNVANRGLGRDSGHGAVSDDLNDQGIDDAAQVVERDLLAKNQSRSSRATAPGARSIPRSPANREPSSPTRVAPDNDLNEAVRAVENDLQSKIQARRGRGGQPVAPGARPVDSQEAAEMDSVISRKDPRASAHYSENPAEDGSIQTNQIEIGAQSSANQPTTVGNRMEQKVLQMEQEQQARDQKLEEIEEMNLRRVGPERSKDFASPSPDTDGPGGDDIENGFLNPDPEAIRQAEEDGLAIAVAIEEDEEPDVYDVELKMYDPDSKPPFHNNRRFRFYSCCICLLALVGIITAAVLVSSNNGGGTKILYETEAPSAAPTQGPTTSRDFAVQSEIARVVGDVVKEPGSVYDEALEWILYEDPMQLDEFSENLIQRYILVLFYLKTSGANRDSWISCNPPQEGENSSCTFYENLMDPQTFEEYWEPREELETRWLSEKHECEWAEVTCHPVSDGNVIAIDILGQNLTGTLPDDLKHLQRLMWLTVSFNELEGTIPEAYGELPYLTIFECNDNWLTGEIPAGFFRQPNLLQFSPNMNLLSGTIPSEIGLLTTLHSLFWFGTLVEGTIPSEVGLLEDVRNLWWMNNFLTGTIPSEIGNLHLLQSFYVEDNQLSGSLPTEVGELSAMQAVRLHRNQLGGPLPSELGRLKNVVEFNFALNDASGATIPAEIFDMESVVFMDLNTSNFAGPLSPNVGSAKSLMSFRVSGNELTGTIPSEIGLLEGLIQLFVHNNYFTGSVPNEVCQLRGPSNLQFLNADCGGAIPEVTCITGCCTGCCDEFGQCQRTQ